MGSGPHSHQQELLNPKLSPRQQFFSPSSTWAPAPCHSHRGLHHPLQPPVPHLRSCVFSDFPLTPPFQVYPGPTWRNRPPGANSDPKEHGLGVPPASSLSSGTSYYGLSWRRGGGGTAQPGGAALGPMPWTHVVQGDCFPSWVRSFSLATPPWLLRANQGEGGGGGGCCLPSPLSAAIHGD